MPLLGNPNPVIETNLSKAADAMAEQMVGGGDRLFDLILNDVNALNAAFWRPGAPLTTVDVLNALKRLAVKLNRPTLIKDLFTLNAIIGTAVAQAAAAAGQTVQLVQPTMEFQFEGNDLVLGAPISGIPE